MSVAVALLAILALWGALKLDSVKRMLVSVLDVTPSPVAAANVTTLTGVFDGLDTERPQHAMRLAPVITGIPQPTDLAFVPGHPNQVIVLSKLGVATWVDLTTGSQREWLTVEVATTSELGLLGIAFHPRFPEDPRFWLNTTPSLGGQRAATRVEAWKMNPDRTAQRVSTVLELEQPYQNHNAGQLAFGPDGALYVGFGDGGFRDDPLNSGQDPSTLLGSMVRLDVAVNKPEVWATGLRNPWRFTFDPSGRMIVADVGQNSWEEIDIVQQGDNLGWRLREGRHCFEPAAGCPTEGLVDPIYEYGRDDGISITGGVVWTGPGPLQGRYLFADFGSGRLWALSLPDDRSAPTDDVLALGHFDLSPSAFVRAPDGSAWVAGFRSGAVYKLIE